jgi:hypothetical protein
VQALMQDTIEALASDAPSEVLAVRSALMHHPKNAAAWKPVLARLELLERLTSVLGLSGGGGGGGKGGGSKADRTMHDDHGKTLQTQEVMAFVAPVLGHANGRVRAAAIRLAVLCFNAAVRCCSAAHELCRCCATLVRYTVLCFNAAVRCCGAASYELLGRWPGR